MRPVFIPTLPLLVMAWLAFMPMVSSAQGDGGNPASDDAATSLESTGRASDEAPLTAQEKAEARRIARLEREREAERQRLERERLCVIKPVMTDAEIARCKEVWR